MTDLEVYQPHSDVAQRTPSDIDSWTQVAGQVIKLANEIYDTPFVPDGLRGSVPATAAAILAGRELGLGPMTSLANVHVIKGKPALSAALMRALILSQGHQIETVDISDTRAIVKGRRKGEAAWEEASFTADQAKRAGIQLGGYPQDKLYARATSRLARRKFADVIAGMPYSAEELEDGEADGEASTAPPANGTANGNGSKTAARTARRKTPAAAVPDEKPASGPAATAGPDPAMPPLPGEEDEKPPPSAPGSDRHRKLVGIVQGHFKRLGFNPGDSETDEEKIDRLTTAAKLAAVSFDPGSTNDFDEDELSVIADTLARCKDRAALDALLEAGEKQGGDSDA